MAIESKCSKCGGAMTEGFILDHGHHQVKQQQVWVEGEPESSFWSGLKTLNRESFNVSALRCTDCSFLEFYTTNKADLGGIFN